MRKRFQEVEIFWFFKHPPLPLINILVKFSLLITVHPSIQLSWVMSTRTGVTSWKLGYAVRSHSLFLCGNGHNLPHVVFADIISLKLTYYSWKNISQLLGGNITQAMKETQAWKKNTGIFLYFNPNHGLFLNLKIYIFYFPNLTKKS